MYISRKKSKLTESRHQSSLRYYMFNPILSGASVNLFAHIYEPYQSRQTTCMDD